jgi:outer membrane protein OmpA-like peptidoglycan-associated protein
MAATSDSGNCPTQITFTPAERERLEGLIGKYQPIDPHTFSLEFVYDSDALTPDGQQAFKSMVADMASRKASTVKVIGYTDSVGSDAYNLDLSKQRADAVVKLLVDQGLVKRPFITAEGRGKLLKDDIDRGEGCRDSLATPDQTPEPHNRCVEISVR